MSMSPKRLEAIRNSTTYCHKIQRTGDVTIDSFRDRMMQMNHQGGFAGLRRSMRALEEQHEGQLTPDEFLQGFQEFGVQKFGKADVDRLFMMIDRDRIGMLSFNEFIRGVRPELSMRRQKLVLQAYKALDTNGNSSVSLKEMCALYDPRGHPEVISGNISEDEILNDFTQVWDEEEDRAVPQEEFMQYYADIGANIDNDDYFELMVRNAWHLSGGEGMCRNTTCLRVTVTFRDGRVQVLEVKDDLRLNHDDMDAIKRKLMQQGIENIKDIELGGHPQ